MQNITPPYNPEAEKGVIGAILIKNDNLCEINLEPSDFFYLPHKLIFKAMQELYSQSKEIDPISLMDYFKGNLDSIGGMSYLADLINSNIRLDKHKIQIVKDSSNLRKLQTMLMQGIEGIKDKKSFKELIEEFQTEIMGFETSDKKYIVSDKELMVRTLDMIETNYNNKGQTLGLSTHITSIDKAINGLQPKKLYVIAGRPGMGKSALAINIGHNISKHNKVAYFSTEMGEEELGLRRVAMSSFINTGALERGDLTQDGWSKLNQTVAKVSNYGSTTNCKSNISMFDVRNQCQKMKLQGGLDLIILDHIGYMDMKGMGATLREQTSQICLQFKNMAKDFEIPIIILSQLSRSCEARGNKRPMLSDLKESGGIEENADCVLLLYRDEYYNPDTNDKDVIECNVAKQRSGKCGVIKLSWQPNFQLITDIARY